MDGQLAVQGMIPVYRLVSRDELLRARSDLAINVTEMRWPR